MDAPIQRLRLAAYAVIADERGILLCRMGASERDVGAWTLPGGGLDFGESPEECALREVFEETGLVVALGRLVEVQSEVFVSPEAQIQAIRFVYLARAVGGELRNEVDGSTDLCEWVSFDTVHDLPLVPLAGRGCELARASV